MITFLIGITLYRYIGETSNIEKKISKNFDPVKH